MARPPAAASRPTGPAPNGSLAGLELDGAVYPLEGEPPVARPGNWHKPYGT